VRNFGKAPKNYGPPDHFRFQRMGDAEILPLYTAPSYGQAPESLISAGQAGVGLAVVAGFLVLGPLVVYPFIIKGFKPELSYGRRVGIGLGISIGLAAVTSVARAALSKKES